MKRALRGIALGLALAACGGAEGPGGASPQPTRGYLVAIVPAPPELPFDPRSARLTQATDALTTVAGHPVSFELDAALLPQWRSSFEEELIASIENVARDLTELRKEDPEELARAAPKLEKIACRYRAVAHGADGAFDFERGTLTITEPPNVSSLVARGIVRRAIDDERDAWQHARYRTKMPDDIPPVERQAYFEYLTRTRPGYGNSSERREDPATDPRSETIARVARLGEMLAGTSTPFAQAVRAWLVELTRYWVAEQDDTRNENAPGPPRQRAVAAWVRWLNADLPSLSDADKVALARAVFPRRGRCKEERDCPDVPPGLPGFDRFAFGLSVVDAWQREGRATDGEGAHFGLIDTVVCPHTILPDGRRSRHRSCNAGFYPLALATPATRARLAQELGKRGDPRLVDEVFSNADLEPASRVVAMWRALEPYPNEWNTASRVIVEHLLPAHEYGEALYAEANRLWRDAPERRGTALYVLAHQTADLDRHYADPRWADLPKTYGEPVSGKVFASFLDQGPRAIPLVPVIWPALSKGWSRAEAILPRLGAFLEAIPTTRADPSKVLRAIAGRMCDEHATQDLARLHAWLERNVGSTMPTLVLDTAGCKAPRT